MPTRTVDRRRLGTLAAAAAVYGISQRTLRRYISAGRVTAYRFGPRMVRVDLDEVDRVLMTRIPGGGNAA